MQTSTSNINFVLFLKNIKYTNHTAHSNLNIITHTFKNFEMK